LRSLPFPIKSVDYGGFFKGYWKSIQESLGESRPQINSNSLLFDIRVDSWMETGEKTSLFGPSFEARKVNHQNIDKEYQSKSLWLMTIFLFKKNTYKKWIHKSYSLWIYTQELLNMVGYNFIASYIKGSPSTFPFFEGLFLGLPKRKCLNQKFKINKLKNEFLEGSIQSFNSNAWGSSWVFSISPLFSLSDPFLKDLLCENFLHHDWKFIMVDFPWLNLQKRRPNSFCCPVATLHTDRNTLKALMKTETWGWSIFDLIIKFAFLMRMKVFFTFPARIQSQKAFCIYDGPSFHMQDKERGGFVFGFL